VLSLRTGGITREVQTLWKKNMDAIGLRTDFNVAPFQDIIKDLEKGKFQMYQGGFGGSPSGYNEHSQLHGKQPQRVNVPQFANADYDRAAEASCAARPTKSRSPRRAPCTASRARTCRSCPCISGWNRTTSSRGSRAFVLACSRATGNTSTSTPRGRSDLWTSISSR
jgi:hypothetical protein